MEQKELAREQKIYLIKVLRAGKYKHQDLHEIFPEAVREQPLFSTDSVDTVKSK